VTIVWPEKQNGVFLLISAEGAVVDSLGSGVATGEVVCSRMAVIDGAVVGEAVGSGLAVTGETVGTPIGAGTVVGVTVVGGAVGLGVVGEAVGSGLTVKGDTKGEAVGTPTGAGTVIVRGGVVGEDGRGSGSWDGEELGTQ